MPLLGIAGGAGPDTAGAAFCCFVFPGVPILVWLISVAYSRGSSATAVIAVTLPMTLGLIVADVAANTHPDPRDPEQGEELAQAWNTVWIYITTSVVVGLIVSPVVICQVSQSWRAVKMPIDASSTTASVCEPENAEVGHSIRTTAIEADTNVSPQVPEDSQMEMSGSLVSGAPSGHLLYRIRVDWLLAICFGLLAISVLVMLTRRS